MSAAALRGPLAILIVVIVGTYVGMCAWMYLKQRDLMYFPQFTRVQARDTDFELRRDRVTLRGWRVNPGHPTAIVYFGGNAERIERARDPFARWFPTSTVYLVAYRGYGASDGTPREPALFADALAVFDHVRAHHRGPIAVVGRSLGSGVAGYLASQRPVARLALITPFDSLAAVASAHYPWLPTRWLIKDRYETARALSDYRAPVLVIRAGRDTLIPAANTTRLIRALPVAPRVVTLPAADHNSLDNDPAYAAALVEFLRASPSVAGAELLVVDIAGERAIRSAQRALRVRRQPGFAEAHGQGVELQQASRQRVADPEDQLDRLGRL